MFKVEVIPTDSKASLALKIRRAVSFSRKLTPTLSCGDDKWIAGVHNDLIALMDDADEARVKYLTQYAFVTPSTNVATRFRGLKHRVELVVALAATETNAAEAAPADDTSALWLAMIIAVLSALLVPHPFSHEAVLIAMVLGLVAVVASFLAGTVLHRFNTKLVILWYTLAPDSSLARLLILMTLKDAVDALPAAWVA